LRLFQRLFGRDRAEAAGDALYVALVGHARQPAFYAELGVPDTVEGRFDMIALVVALAVRRLKDGDAAGRALAQAVFDSMFRDMDRSLREMGVGDMSVGRKVQNLAKGFYGRLAAYDAALAADDAALRETLVRNVYAETAPAPAALDRLAAHVRAFAAALAATPVETLLQGRLPHLEP